MKIQIIITGALLLVLSAAPAFADLSFWRDLADKQTATWGDAVRTGAGFIQDSNEIQGFEDAEAVLQQAGILEGMVVHPAEAPLRRGTVALLYLRLLRIQGGLMFHLFPNSERYAHREASYQGLLAAGKTASFVSGAELISVYSRCQTFREKHGGAAIYAPEEGVLYERAPDEVAVPNPVLREVVQ